VTPSVGLIVNPAAGRDIRRLVAGASLMPNHEKTAVCRRVLEGLAAVGAGHVWVLDDGVGIVAGALGRLPRGLSVDFLPVELEGTAEDSTRAAGLLCDRGVGAIVAVGGDGTSRAIARSCRDVPLVAVSTGTNNVFPTLIEGTIAGMATGLVAAGAVPLEAVARRAKRIEVNTGGDEDIALIDAAICSDPFVGSRAIWDPNRVRAVVLSRAEPWAVGLSSIGGRLRPLTATDPYGLYVELGSGPGVLAPVAPGKVVEVPVADWRILELGEEVELAGIEGTIALDGERELMLRGPARARVTERGPVVVDVRAALEAASVREVLDA